MTCTSTGGVSLVIRGGEFDPRTRLPNVRRLGVLCVDALGAGASALDVGVRPLWKLRCSYRLSSGLLEDWVDFSGDVALETADDCFLREAFAGAPIDVRAGGGVARHSHERDTPQGPVRVPVASTVETVVSLPSGGSVDGRDTTERGETPLMTETLGVVTGSDKQGHCGLDTNTVHRDQLRCSLVHELGQPKVKVGEFVGECLPASGQGVERVAVCTGRVGGALGRQRAISATSTGILRPMSCSRSWSGAVSMSVWIWFAT